MKKKYNKYDETLATVANLIWFGAWLYIIFGLHQSGWWILVPIIIHWSSKE